MSFDKNKDHSQIMGGGLAKWSQAGKTYDRDFKEIEVQELQETTPVTPAVKLKDFKAKPEPLAPKPEAPVVEETPKLATYQASIKSKAKKDKARPFGARDE